MMHTFKVFEVPFEAWPEEMLDSSRTVQRSKSLKVRNTINQIHPIHNLTLVSITYTSFPRTLFLIIVLGFASSQLKPSGAFLQKRYC